MPRKTWLAVVINLLLLSMVLAIVFFSQAKIRSHTSSRRPNSVPPKRVEVLRLGKIPNISTKETYRRYDKLLSSLAQKLEVDRVDLVLAPDYDTCIRYLLEGKIDIAWLGTYTYLTWRGKAPIEPLVRPLWSGRPYYRGIIFAVEGRGIRKIEDLKGKRFAFVDKQSASGYLFASELLESKGIRVPQDLAAADFLGNHQAVLLAVILGEYDAGAVFDRSYETLPTGERGTKLIVLGETKPIPSEPIVVLSSAPDDFKQRVRAAFLSLSLSDIATGDFTDLQGFVPVEAREYDALARCLEKP